MGTLSNSSSPGTSCCMPCNGMRPLRSALNYVARRAQRAGARRPGAVAALAPELLPPLPAAPTTMAASASTSATSAAMSAMSSASRRPAARCRVRAFLRGTSKGSNFCCFSWCCNARSFSPRPCTLGTWEEGAEVFQVHTENVHNTEHNSTALAECLFVESALQHPAVMSWTLLLA